MFGKKPQPLDPKDYITKPDAGIERPDPGGVEALKFSDAAEKQEALYRGVLNLEKIAQGLRRVDQAGVAYSRETHRVEDVSRGFFARIASWFWRPKVNIEEKVGTLKQMREDFQEELRKVVEYANDPSTPEWQRLQLTGALADIHYVSEANASRSLKNLEKLADRRLTDAMKAAGMNPKKGKQGVLDQYNRGELQGSLDRAVERGGDRKALDTVFVAAALLASAEKADSLSDILVADKKERDGLLASGHTIFAGAIPMAIEAIRFRRPLEAVRAEAGERKDKGKERIDLDAEARIQGAEERALRAESEAQAALAKLATAESELREARVQFQSSRGREDVDVASLRQQLREAQEQAKAARTDVRTTRKEADRAAAARIRELESRIGREEAEKNKAVAEVAKLKGKLAEALKTAKGAPGAVASTASQDVVILRDNLKDAMREIARLKALITSSAPKPPVAPAPAPATSTPPPAAPAAPAAPVAPAASAAPGPDLMSQIKGGTPLRNVSQQTPKERVEAKMDQYKPTSGKSGVAGVLMRRLQSAGSPIDQAKASLYGAYVELSKVTVKKDKDKSDFEEIERFVDQVSVIFERTKSTEGSAGLDQVVNDAIELRSRVDDFERNFSGNKKFKAAVRQVGMAAEKALAAAVEARDEALEKAADAGDDEWDDEF